MYKYYLLAVILFLAQGLEVVNYDLTREEYDDLIALEDAPVWTLEGNEYIGKIQRVIDGDSVKMIILLNNNFYKFDFRVNRIDTPELRSGVVREFGAEVGDILEQMIEGKLVKTVAGEFDKYGRVLSEIYGMTDDGQEININDYLVQHGMAKLYDGGTK